ncbi:hypothetical protein D3C76_779030 [compost metagenome]
MVVLGVLVVWLGDRSRIEIEHIDLADIAVGVGLNIGFIVLVVRPQHELALVPKQAKHLAVVGIQRDVLLLVRLGIEHQPGVPRGIHRTVGVGLLQTHVVIHITGRDLADTTVGKGMLEGSAHIGGVRVEEVFVRTEVGAATDVEHAAIAVRRQAIGRQYVLGLMQGIDRQQGAIRQVELQGAVVGPVIVVVVVNLVLDVGVAHHEAAEHRALLVERPPPCPLPDSADPSCHSAP